MGDLAWAKVRERRQARGDESIKLTAEDERILDELAAKRRQERREAAHEEKQVGDQTERPAAVVS